MVQAMHAIHAAGLQDKNQYQQLPSIVLIQVENKEDLAQELENIQDLGIECVSFEEPYLNMGLTSFSTLPITEDKREYFQHYELWGKNMEQYNPLLNDYLKEEKKVMRKIQQNHKKLARMAI